MTRIANIGGISIPAALSRSADFQSVCGLAADTEVRAGASDQEIADLERFIAAVTPGHGVVVVDAPAGKGGRMHHTFCDTPREAAQCARAANQRGRNVYFTPAAFDPAAFDPAAFGPKEGGRKAENVAKVGSLWLDIDCGSEKPYPTQADGLEALSNFQEAVGLPHPIIINSGRGLHVYWPLRSAITRHEWLPLAEALKHKCTAYGLTADPSRTCDAASLMRVPCTMNRKDPANPLPTGILEWRDEPLTPEQACSLLAIQDDDPDGAADCAGTMLGELPEHLQGISADNRDLRDPAAGHWADHLTAEDRDQFLKAIVTLPDIKDIAHGSRDPWLKALAAMRALGAPSGREIARQWSQTAPEKFDRQAFDHAWDRGPRDRITVGTLIHLASGAGLDLEPWRKQAGMPAEDRWGLAAEDKPAPIAAPAARLPDDLAKFDVAAGWNAIPRREWLLGTAALRGEITVFAAPGGTGKSAFLMALAIGAASGQDLLGHAPPHPLRAAIINAEDGREENLRRAAAAAQHHNIPLSDLAGRIFLFGAGDLGKLELNRVSARGRQGEVSQEGIALLEDLVTRLNLDLLILDPLVALCPGGLNDNALAAATMAAIKQMAQRTGCGVLIAHHTRKGSGRGDNVSVEDASGAAAITNLARVAFSLSNPSDDDARNCGVLPSDRWRIVEMTNGKANFSPKTARNQYWLESVTLSNGDNVQAIERFTPNVGKSLIPNAAWRDVLVAIAAGDNGKALSPSIRANACRAAPVIAQALKPHLPQEPMSALEGMAATVISDATTKGWLTTAKVKVPKRHPRDGLMVVWSATPWATEPPPSGHVQ